MKHPFKLRFATFAPIVLMGLMLASCSGDDEEEEVTLPQVPALTSVSPAEGTFNETVTLRGVSLGTDAAQLRVFFNQKEAEIVSLDGDSIINVRVPRLPGDDCRIGILKGTESTDTVFCQQRFSYKSGNRLEYVCGNVGSTNGKFEPGRLVAASFGRAMQWLACDTEGKIYMNEANVGNGGSIDLIDLEAGRAVWLSSADESNRGGQAIGPWFDKETNKVYVCAAHRGYFWEVDIANNRTTTQTQLTEPTEEQIAAGYRHVSLESLQWCYSFAKGSDGFVYCRDYSGHLFRFKLSEKVVDLVTGVCPKSPVDVYMCTDPEDNSKLYCSLKQKNIITVIDITKDPSDPDFETVVCGTEGSGDFADGSATEARLNEPQQILVTRHPVTGKKVIFICDSKNRRVRQYDFETGMMTTIAGNGDSWGYGTGVPTEAPLVWPIGICQNPDGDLYISDSGNRTIMKLLFQ